MDRRFFLGLSPKRLNAAFSPRKNKVKKGQGVGIFLKGRVKLAQPAQINCRIARPRKAFNGRLILTGGRRAPFIKRNSNSD